MILPLLLSTAFSVSPACAVEDVAEAAFASAPVEDEALSEMRGGFALPGGLDVSVAVQSDTRVNGALLLRSVFVIDKGAPELSVFGRTDGVAGAASDTAGRVSSSTVTFSNAAATIGGASEGLTDLGALSAGVTVAASGGQVRVDRAGAATQVVLSQPTLNISHLAGQAYGTVIANRGNDVAIDTATNINIDLRNALPSNIGSTMFRVDALVNDSAARLGR